MTDVIMPQMGESIAEGTITKWMKNVGDKILRDEPVPASSVMKTPRHLDAVIGRALRKQRDARYDSAAHLAGDLECLLEGKPPVHATQLGPLETLALSGAQVPKRPPTAPKIVHRASSSDELYIVDEPPRHGPLRLAAAIVLGVGLGVGVVLVVQQRAKGTEEPEINAAQPSVPAATPAAVRSPAPAPTPTISTS